MFKKLFGILALLIFLINISNVMGATPGLDEWKDDMGRPAPASVRRAADMLWTAVKIEGEAAFDAGWGVPVEYKEKCGSYQCFKCVMCCISCGVSVCLGALCEEKPKYGEVCRDGLYNGYASIQRATFDRRTEEVTAALQTFKDTINRSVLRPEPYSGDARICELGPWVRDNAWYKDSRPQYGFASVRRDLSGVLQSTKSFVKAHGGWAPEGKEIIVRLIDES